MVVIWLIEFILIALIVVLLIVFAQKIITRNRRRMQTQKFSLELMRFEEAKTIILQHASLEVMRGVPLEQALLKVLSDDYFPEAEAWEKDKTAEPDKTR